MQDRWRRALLNFILFPEKLKKLKIGGLQDFLTYTILHATGPGYLQNHSSLIVATHSTKTD